MCMEKAKFLNELEEILEIDNLTEMSSLELTSLQVLAIIIFIDENYNKLLTAEELKSIHSVNDLISLIGVTF